MAVAGSLEYGVQIDDDGFKTGLNSMEKEVEKTSGAMDVFLGNIATQLAGYAVQGLKEIVATGVSYNAQMESYQTSFEVMLGSQELAVAKMAELKAFSSSTPFELGDLASATNQLLAFGVQNEDTMGIMKQLGDISLGNVDKFNTLISSYGKMNSSGKVSLDTLNMMIEQGFNPLSLVAEKTGESMEDLYDRVSAGGVAFEEIQEAIADATEEGGQFFGGLEAQSRTYDGQISTLKDNLNTFMGEAMQPLFTFLSETAIPILNDLLTGGARFQTWFEENEQKVILFAIAIGTLTFAILAYNIAMNATAIATGIATFATGAFGAVLAFATSPITLIILAIGALIAIIYLLVSNWDLVKEKTIEVVESMKDKFKDVAQWFSDVVINPIIDRFKLWFSDITAVFENVKGIFNGIISFVKNVFTGNWRGAWEDVVSIFSNIFEGIGNILKIPLNFIIDNFNTMIAGLNKLKIPDWVPELGGKGVNIPTIPRLATGGVVDSATLAIIGEAGKEAVVPLENNTGWVNQVADLFTNAILQDKSYNGNENITSSYNNSSSKFELVADVPLVTYLDGNKIYENQQKITFRKRVGGVA